MKRWPALTTVALLGSLMASAPTNTWGQDAPPHARMTSEYHSILTALRTKSSAERAEFLSSGHAERAVPIAVLKGENRDQLQTYVWLERWDRAVIDAIAAAGAIIEGEDPDQLVVQALVPLDKAEAVAAVKGVVHLRRPSYGIASSGSVTTEGDAAVSAQFLRTIGNVDGNGIKVGVISTGLFNSLFPVSRTQGLFRGSNGDSRIQSGDLPFAGATASTFAPTAGVLGAIQVFPASLALHFIDYPNEYLPFATYGETQTLSLRGETLTVQSITTNIGVDTVSLSGTMGSANLTGGQVSFLGDYEVAVDEVSNGDQPFVTLAVHYNPEQEITSPEGAAILETIHDIAPKASLFYGKGTTSVDLVAARNYMLARGVNVIIDNMLFYDAGRLDGSSTLSRRAQEIAVLNNISYIVSAGNYTPPPPIVENTSTELSASSRRFPLFINGYFTPSGASDAPKLHNFSAGRFQTTEDVYLTMVPQNGTIDAVLIWDDVWTNDSAGAAQDDLDLYLNEIKGAQIGSVVASSIDFQRNSGRPYERITVRPGDSLYGLSIRRKDTLDASRRLFTLMILQGTVRGEDVRYLTHGLPLANGDAPPPVISVGAIDIDNGLSTVSSETVPGLAPGPGRARTNSFVRWYSTQQAPSVVSYSNTSALSNAFFNGAGTRVVGRFTGSSAAAAHVAGVVALLRHSRPTIPAYEFYDILRNTVPPSGSVFPNAVRINPEVAVYPNAPSYLRTNAYDTYENILAEEGSTGRTARSAKPMLVSGAEKVWQSSPKVDPFAQPVFGETTQGLTISPAGQLDVFGWWETPNFEFSDGNGGTTTELRADRIYELSVRVGCDETDATRVPNFRLRLSTGANDEVLDLVVNGISAEGANAPNTIGGQEYRLYYRPTTEAVAKQGIRFAFDLTHFDKFDNGNATFFINDIALREVTQLP